MIPYFLKDGKKVNWSTDKANILYQRFRDDIIDELRKRDSSRGIPDNSQVYDEIKGDKKDADKVTGFKVNLILAGQKHAGAETNNRLKKKWFDYCSDPHDVPDDLVIPLVEPTYKPSMEPGDPGNTKTSKDNPVSFQEPGELHPVSVPDMIAAGEKERAKKSKRDLKG